MNSTSGTGTTTATSIANVFGNVKTFVNNHLTAFIGCGTTILVVLIIAILAYRKLMEIRNAKSNTKRKRHNVDEDDFEYTVDEKEEKAKYGWLSCRIIYKYEESCLRIEKIQCTSLFSPEGYMLNSFIKIRMEPRRWTLPEYVTPVFPNSNDPLFNSTYKFKLSPNKLKHAILIWEIFDKDLTSGKDVGVGVVKLTLITMDPKTYHNIPKELRLRVGDNKGMKIGCGDICIILRNNPLEKKFKITVLEAKNLNIKPVGNYPPVYATVAYYHKKKSLGSGTTETRYNTNCPYFMDSFVFPLKVGKTANSHVMVKMWRKPLIGMDKCIGYVDIGYESKSISGRKHWMEMVTNANKAMAVWHPLLDE